ncbi:MAG: hypothetical protein DRI36_05230 [Caldiserica bacterium]|nr:MAG: hypothetical protein DRI36_05230 [Caldisericota bacterium]
MEILLISLIVGFISIDTIKVGQFMFSRPIIVGSIVGWILGDFYTGLKIGVILELFWIRVIPVGTYYPPDTVITTALAITLTLYFPGANIPESFCIILSLMVSIPFGIIYKSFQIRERKMASRYNTLLSDSINKGDFNFINKLVFISVGREFMFSFLAFIISFKLIFLFFSSVQKYLFYFIENPFMVKGAKEAFELLPLIGITQLIDSFIKKR